MVFSVRSSEKRCSAARCRFVAGDFGESTQEDVGLLRALYRVLAVEHERRDGLDAKTTGVLDRLSGLLNALVAGQPLSGQVGVDAGLGRSGALAAELPGPAGTLVSALTATSSAAGSSMPSV